jgi:16S rRNA (cytosine967-C5)-methyltransferase
VSPGSPSTQAGSGSVPGAAVRAASARVLLEVHGGRSLKAVLGAHQAKLRDGRDRALCEAMCLAALRRHARYAALLEALLDKPLPQQARSVQFLLHVGFAQLEELGLPEHAAVASSCEAARLLGFPRLVGLINAVLRRFLRERAQLPALGPTQEAARAHPDWLLAHLRADWPQHYDSIMQANLQPPPLWLRLCVHGHSREQLLLRFAEAGAEVLRFQGDALALRGAGDPSRLPGFAEGAFTVQDIAAQAAVAALEVQAGMRVLDACAAPGGKAAQIAAAGGRLLALDSDDRRLRRVEETLRRLRVEAELRCADAGDPRSWWDGRPFERILLDAPCSATGVIRRQPDILLHRRATDIPALCAQQTRLLKALWPLLTPGGRLVYATCSVLKDENERQVDAFLAAHCDARALPLADGFGRDSGSGYQRLPGEDDGDGFFVAALSKLG